MSYRQEMDSLARHLATAIASGEPLRGMDLEAAVAGVNATVNLVRTVHEHVAGPVSRRFPRDLATVERQPVRLLGRLLQDMPALEHAAPTTIQLSPAATQTGAHWRAVARSATLALYHWQTAIPDSRPTGDAARAEMVQVAALTEGLAVAGVDVATHLDAAGQTADAARLRQASTSGLRVVAAAARQASTGQYLAPVVELRSRPSRAVVIVRRASHVPAALTRLAALVSTADHLTPQHIQLIAGAAGGAALAAGRTLTAAGHPAMATALRVQAEHLAQVASSGQTAASVLPGDARPLAQAQQIHYTLADLRRRGVEFEEAEALAVAGALPDVTQALSEGGRRQLDRGGWLVNRHDLGLSATWAPWRPGLPEPPLITRLTTGAEHGDVVRAAVEGVAVGGRPPSADSTVALERTAIAPSVHPRLTPSATRTSPSSGPPARGSAFPPPGRKGSRARI
jgi:hypothetical protein